MAVYVTNHSDIKGVVKVANGNDYIIPAEVVDYVIGQIDLADIVYQSSYVITKSAEDSFVDRAAPVTPYYLFRFKGYIQFSTDFPIPSVVSRGDTYKITNNVIDNNASRTNTGQSFGPGDQVYWNDSQMWTRDESIESAAEGFRWTNPVLDRLPAPPGGESIGDRYLVSSTGATGDWTGKENNIAELTATGWEFTAPEPNLSLVLATNDIGYTYDETAGAWVPFSGTVDAGPGLIKPTPDKIQMDLYNDSLEFVGVGDAGKVKVAKVDGGTF